MREEEKGRFGNTIKKDIPDRFRKDIINYNVKNAFDKSRQMFLDKYKSKINGVNINDSPLEIVSPEFDLITIGHAFTNGFTKQLPRILLKKKNNKLPISLRTQIRFSNAGNAVKNEVANNIVENYILNDY